MRDENARGYRGLEGKQPMRIGLLIQSRVNSTRFPGKVFEMLGDKQVLRHLVDTCESVKIFPKALEIKTHILIPIDDERAFNDYLDKCLFTPCDENDLLTRYKNIVSANGFDSFLRLTSDCPLITRNLIEDAITALMTYDYVSNTIIRTCVDGLDVQGMSAKAFAWYTAQLNSEEHLFRTLDGNISFQQQFQNAGFSMHQIVDGSQNIANPYHQANKLSIDTPDDLERLRKIYEARKK